MGNNRIKLGETIFTDIDDNEYLLTLYKQLLGLYGRKLFNLGGQSNNSGFSDKGKVGHTAFLGYSFQVERSGKSRLP